MIVSDVRLQAVNVVGESVYVICVTAGRCGEYVYQLAMFAILQYEVTLVIKTIIFSPVFRKLALTWQEICTQIVVCAWPKCYNPSTKRMWSLTTELYYISAVYIMCPCDLDLWPIFRTTGSRDSDAVMNVCVYLEVYRNFRFWNMRPRISDLVVQLLSNRRCYGNHYVPLLLGAGMSSSR